MDSEKKTRLTNLLAIISPSMQEDNMTNYLLDDWSKIYPDGIKRKDDIGNIEFSIIKDHSFPNIALVAHSDTICIQLTFYIGNGKFKFRSVGALPHMLLGQAIIVITENGEEIEGVIGFDATSQYGQPKGLIFEDLWIDIIDETKWENVSTGDLAVLKPRYNISKNGIITATALDDRLGLFIIGEIIRTIKNTDLPINLICVATVQEEVGLRGSACFKFSQQPDVIIVLDVDYATDIPTPHEDQIGRLFLGYGPGLQKKADNSPKLRKFIQKVAESRSLPFQISLGRFIYGGTDSTTLQTARECKSNCIANISIPCRYMHSPVETASLNDVMTAIKIIESFAIDISKKSSIGT